MYVINSKENLSVCYLIWHEDTLNLKEKNIGYFYRDNQYTCRRSRGQKQIQTIL